MRVIKAYQLKPGMVLLCKDGSWQKIQSVLCERIGHRQIIWFALSDREWDIDETKLVTVKA